MIHNFEIKVQCKGNAAGTLGWLNEILLNGELVIRNNKDGKPALFLHEKTDLQGIERPAEKGNTFICRLDDDTDPMGYEQCRVNNTDLLCAYVQGSENGYKYGFVDYPLTPAARDKAEEFLSAAFELFVNWWESDK